MALSFAYGRGPWETGGVLHFQAYDRDEPVTCGIARPALDMLDGRQLKIDELQPALARHTRVIRAALERKYVTGLREADGALIIYGGDLRAA